MNNYIYHIYRFYLVKCIRRFTSLMLELLSVAPE